MIFEWPKNPKNGAHFSAFQDFPATAICQKTATTTITTTAPTAKAIAASI